MKNAVYTNIIDTWEPLWQHIQDAENDIHTASGVLKCVWALFCHHSDACIHASGGHFEHLFNMCNK
jgi:hypothetical protein